MNEEKNNGYVEKVALISRKIDVTMGMKELQIPDKKMPVYLVEKICEEEFNTSNIFDAEMRQILTDFLYCNIEKDFIVFFEKYTFLFNQKMEIYKEIIPNTQSFLINLVELVNCQKKEIKVNYNILLVYLLRVIFTARSHSVSTDGSCHEILFWGNVINTTDRYYNRPQKESFLIGQISLFDIIEDYTFYDTYNEQEISGSRQEDNWFYEFDSKFEEKVYPYYTNTYVSGYHRKIVDFVYHLIKKHGGETIKKIIDDEVNDSFIINLDKKEKQWINKLADYMINYFLNEAFSHVNVNITVSEEGILHKQFYVEDLYYAMLLLILYCDNKNISELKMKKCKQCGQYFYMSRNNNQKQFCTRTHAQQYANHTSYLRKKAKKAREDKKS